MQTEVKPYNPDTDKKEQVTQMFNNIAHRYDFLNRFLSFGIDRSWRRKAIDSLRQVQPQHILDIATGTADFAIEACKLKPQSIVGRDISAEMLRIGRQKIAKRGLQSIVEIGLGDAENIEFADENFDAVTVAFGVRNFQNRMQGLREMHRVLKPGGKLVVLELSVPTMFPIRQLYNFYSFALLPLWGRMVSSDKRAYSYLPESIAAFPNAADFANELSQVGFASTQTKPLTLGIVTLHTAIK